ncbi:hypothetical protein [Thiomonas sp.]
MRDLAGLGLGVWMALGVVSAKAQTVESPVAPVWRCGNAYSHQPCASGQTIPAQDSRTVEQRVQAQQQQQRLNALLDARERERAVQAAEERQRAASALREQQRLLALQRREARKTRKAAEKAHTVRNNKRLQKTRQRRVVVAPPNGAQP